MQFPAALKDRFWCVYKDGLAVYNHRDLRQCLRHIGNVLNGNKNKGWWKITMKQAMDAGYEVRSV